MPLERFIPKSPDPFIRNSQDFEVAKFGHLNTIIEYVNSYVASDSLQLTGTGPLTSVARYITDSLDNTSTLAISTVNIGIGTTTPGAALEIYGGVNTLGISGPANQAKSIQIARYNNSSFQSHYIGDDGGAFFGSGLTISASGSGSQLYLQVSAAGRNVNIGSAGQTLLPKDLGARLGVRGSGTTSATTAFLVQNSAGSTALQVRDDGLIIASNRIYARDTNTAISFGTSGSQYGVLGQISANLWALGSAVSPDTIQNPLITWNLSNVGIGTTNPSLAKVQIQGSGNTYTTSSLITQNNAGTTTLSVADDGNLLVGGSTITFGTNIYFSKLINNFGTMQFDNDGIGGVLASYTNNRFQTNAYVGFGAVNSAVSRVLVTGTGSTSATTSLLVQNSSGNNALEIKDDRSSTFSGAVTMSGTNTLSGTTNITGLSSSWVCQYSSTGTQKPLSFSMQSGGATTNNSAIRFGFNFRESGGLMSQDFFQNILYDNTSGSVVTGFEWYTHQTQLGDVASQLALSLRGKTLSVGTNTPSASAILQADSTTQGFLPPRMTTAQRTAIVSPAAGLIVYDTTTNKSYTYDGTAWQAHY